jgi:hypothetical protein
MCPRDDGLSYLRRGAPAGPTAREIAGESSSVDVLADRRPGLRACWGACLVGRARPWVPGGCKQRECQP